ncbi:LuxR C-terminal-related transcriptional regulator [Lachnospiraceae bacterium 54-53]
MEMLRETEWLTINKVLLGMYDICSIDAFAARVLRICRMIIPYSKGYFIVFDEKENIAGGHSSFLEMEKKIYENYINSYYEKDYMKYIFDISGHSVTYRDTDIMEESYRRKTEFYREFLRPNNIPYGAGIVLRREGKNIGILNYFRSDLLGDFSDKDMFILDVLKEHLSHMLYRLMEQEKNRERDKALDLGRLAVFYSLSEREKEVLEHILEGRSNAETGILMSISLSTVKKHVYHIFSKMNVSTRTQLRAVLEKSQKVL